MNIRFCFGGEGGRGGGREGGREGGLDNTEITSRKFGISREVRMKERSV